MSNKDTKADLPPKSDETAREKSKPLEKLSNKNSVDFNADGPGSIPEVKFTLESNDLPAKEANGLSNSKDTNNVSQDSHTGQTTCNQNPPDSSNTNCKEPEIDSQWIFLNTVADFMKCKICADVFESPQLLSCCGTNICKKCMNRHLQRLAMLPDKKPLCPFCRSTDFELISNIALEQTINQLKVQCWYQHKGCGWTGILENGNLHLKECDFAPISCPNGCGCEKFERCRLRDHMLICPCTRTTCLFESIGCDVKVPLQHQAAQKHTNDCVSKHLFLIAQKNIQLLKDCRHFCRSLQSESYVNVAKDELVKSQREALTSTQHAIKLLKENLQETQQKIASVRTELRREEICTAEIKKSVSETKNTEATYKESIVQIETIPVPQASGLSCIPVTFTIDNFKKRIKLNDTWLSPPFYTHIGGYKMCLSVHPDCNKPGSAYKRSVSVNIHFLAGEFDEHLTWPFPGAIFTITAINQRANKCNRSANLELDGQDTLYIRSKQIDGGLGHGFGVDFIFHSDLPGFLTRDNCFKLMVYRIQFLP